MSDPTAVLTYGVTIGCSIIGTLLMLLWKLTRDEQERTLKNLELKATKDALDEAKEQHSKDLAGVKAYFIDRLERQHADSMERIKYLTERQDVELDYLKDQLAGFKTDLADFRRESQATTNEILRSLQQIAQSHLRGMQP